MAATIIGTVGKFGLESEQQGMILESQDLDYKTDNKVMRDYRGVKTGVIIYDDQTDVTMKGYIPRENPSAIKLGQTLTLANSAPAHGLTETSGTNVVLGLKIGLKNEDLATFEVTSTIFSFSSAA